MMGTLHFTICFTRVNYGYSVAAVYRYLRVFAVILPRANVRAKWLLPIMSTKLLMGLLAWVFDARWSFYYLIIYFIIKWNCMKNGLFYTIQLSSQNLVLYQQYILDMKLTNKLVKVPFKALVKNKFLLLSTWRLVKQSRVCFLLQSRLRLIKNVIKDSKTWVTLWRCFALLFFVMRIYYTSSTHKWW